MDNDRKRELLKSLVTGLCAERGYEQPKMDDVGEL